MSQTKQFPSLAVNCNAAATALNLAKQHQAQQAGVGRQVGRELETKIAELQAYAAEVSDLGDLIPAAVKQSADKLARDLKAESEHLKAILDRGVS